MSCCCIHCQKVSSLTSKRSDNFFNFYNFYNLRKLSKKIIGSDIIIGMIIRNDTTTFCANTNHPNLHE